MRGMVNISKTFFCSHFNLVLCENTVINRSMMGGGQEIEQEVKEPQLSKGGIRGNREVKKERDE